MTPISMVEDSRLVVPPLANVGPNGIPMPMRGKK
jgi:hypothetical protein